VGSDGSLIEMEENELMEKGKAYWLFATHDNVYGYSTTCTISEHGSGGSGGAGEGGHDSGGSECQGGACAGEDHESGSNSTSNHGNETGNDNGGDEDEGFGNNLAFPAIFSERIGLSGFYVNESTGLRDLENATLGETKNLKGQWLCCNSEAEECEDKNNDTIINENDYSRNACMASHIKWYPQQTENEWQADFEIAEEHVNVTGNWGDNLVRQTWKTNSVIRVEMVLEENLGEQNKTMTAYSMQSLYGEFMSEIFGTNGETYESESATVYSACPRLVIQKLNGTSINGEHGFPVDGGTVLNQSTVEAYLGDGSGFFAAETNVAGKVVYGYNWFMSKTAYPQKEGWWRISFLLDDSVNYTLAGEAIEGSGEEESLSEEGVEGNYPADCQISIENLDAEDLIADSEGRPFYEPQLAGEGRGTYIDIFIESGNGAQN